MNKQRERIMSVLNAGGSLTDNEARDNLGIERLAARISELRKMGYPIGDRWEHGFNRYGDDTKWKRYMLIGGNTNGIPSNNSGQIAELE